MKKILIIFILTFCFPAPVQADNKWIFQCFERFNSYHQHYEQSLDKCGDKPCKQGIKRNFRNKMFGLLPECAAINENLKQKPKRGDYAVIVNHRYRS